MKNNTGLQQSSSCNDPSQFLEVLLLNKNPHLGHLSEYSSMSSQENLSK